MRKLSAACQVIGLSGKRRIAATLTVITLFALATLVIVAARSKAVLPTASQLPVAPVQNVHFALYDAGIYPKEAHAKSGRVIISLVDYSGGTAGLVVEMETALGVRQQIGQVLRRGPHWRVRQQLLLAPGTFYIKDASRPQNTAKLTVEP